MCINGTINHVIGSQNPLEICTNLRRPPGAYRHPSQVNNAIWTLDAVFPPCLLCNHDSWKLSSYKLWDVVQKLDRKEVRRYSKTWKTIDMDYLLTRKNQLGLRFRTCQNSNVMFIYNQHNKEFSISRSSTIVWKADWSYQVKDMILSKQCLGNFFVAN